MPTASSARSARPSASSTSAQRAEGGFMSRTRAADHDLKRRAILDRSAELFAERGYARTSMSEIAEACGSSKALLYHYYENKEQLLYDLLEAHLIKLDGAVKAADAPDAQP